MEVLSTLASLLGVEVLEQEAASLFPLLPHVELGVLEVAVLECLQCDAPLPTSLAAVRSL